MASELAAKLASVAGNQTLTLTHHGRKTGKPYDVTIWFLVEGETVFLVTANAKRQWPRNVLSHPHVTMQVDGQTFSGTAEPIRRTAEREHVMEMVGRKYWYAAPYLWIARILTGTGLVKDSSGAFRVRLDAAA